MPPRNGNERAPLNLLPVPDLGPGSWVAVPIGIGLGVVYDVERIDQVPDAVGVVQDLGDLRELCLVDLP